MFHNILMLFALLTSWSLSAALLTTNNCQKENVLITYEDELDYKHACQAIETIVNIFKKYHFTTSEMIKITFQDQVILEYKSPDQPIPADKIQVYALYDAATNEIFMSKLDSAYIRSRKAFNTLEITPSMHESIILHELAHRYLHLYYRDFLNQNNPDHATHEFFAYFVQIASLNENDQNLVLSLWVDAEFNSDMSINSMIHGIHPHKFGVMSYRYTQHTDIITRILDGSFSSGDQILENFL
ncbi:MAG: hypothetical protein A2381_09255 [Bdellovibrionales bacterium RIFOXYB1_FULL_37_110]|nr:MAG: hypothetical protein A2181_05970 [Bdellovibrionales bacterium RIFOXYA1_FULL_38_20]OFZ49260.1 MAG: hypothetical protein A2417_17145 [Bdellovibrionales bacterium RIFOXYC1_FULL_37_79]OFZ58277.1 MAG: hypothetical protein A2381_09255 [Bdellovibrionales bacterium RIFOXYB1_FULL_37_110]OFZ61521.1 MAG: hypothetical protein A2577_00425 [Bdellovibrionales bacterium RIFOXYD1_FULL_36_51]